MAALKMLCRSHSRSFGSRSTEIMIVRMSRSTGIVWPSTSAKRGASGAICRSRTTRALSGTENLPSWCGGWWRRMLRHVDGEALGLFGGADTEVHAAGQQHLLGVASEGKELGPDRLSTLLAGRLLRLVMGV